MAADAGAPLREGGPQRARVGVIAALALERRSLAAGTRRSGAGSLLVVQSGPGHERATTAARAAIRSGATALVSWGLAGGLTAQARPGAVLVPARVVASDGRVLVADPGWRRDVIARLGDGFERLDGILVSVDRVLATPAAKACSASVSGAVAADMESAAIAAFAAAAGVPFIAVRVIADGSSDVLPRHVDDWVTPAGEATLGPLWRTLLAPRELGRLARLARRSRTATRVLTALAAHVAGVPPPESHGAVAGCAEIAS